MQTRKLGNLEVSAIGLGCMGLSFGLGPAANLDPTPGDLREIDDAFAKIDIKGSPLSEALDSQIDR